MCCAVRRLPMLSTIFLAFARVCGCFVCSICLCECARLPAVLICLLPQYAHVRNTVCQFGAAWCYHFMLILVYAAASRLGHCSPPMRHGSGHARKSGKCTQKGNRPHGYPQLRQHSFGHEWCECSVAWYMVSPGSISSPSPTGIAFCCS